MTIIVCDREIMVSDSRVSIATKGFAYPAIKIIKVNNSLIGCSGDGGDCTRFLEWGKKGFKEKDVPKWKTTQFTEDEIVGLILREDGIYIFTEGGPEPEKVEADFFAIGSGGKSARTAMLMGATPEEAVTLACEVDNIYSGLPIHMLKLKD